jgi:palmitoyltransferase
MPKKPAAKKGKGTPKKGAGKKLSKSKSKDSLKAETPAALPIPAGPNANNSIYCETCEDVICYDSPLMGQHNTQLHRISSIPDAFNSRYDIIVNAIKNTLIPKRTQLIAQITRIDYRIEEIKTVKGIIYRDIKNEYGGVVERLGSAEGVKLAILQYDIAELQKDVNRTDGILQHLDELNGVAQPQLPPGSQPASTLIQPGGQGVDQVGFLLKYKTLQEDIDNLITKQFKVDIPVVPNDLPRELAEKRVKLEEYEKQKLLIKDKNNVVLRLVEEMKVRENTIKDEMDKQTKAHVTQSLNLLDDYANELKKFQLICTFCGVHLDHIAVNLECPRNALIDDVKDFVAPAHFYSSIVPPKEFFATGRHFFVKPEEDASNTMSNNNLILNDEVLRENEHAFSAVKKIRASYTIEKEQELEAKLKQLTLETAEREGRESEDSAIVNRKDFEFLLRSEFKLTGREIQNLLELITPSFDNQINFKSFFSFLRQGQNFEDSFRRNDEEEDIEEDFENTLKRDTQNMNMQGALKNQFHREDSLRTFPLKLNEYDKEFVREQLDYLNAKKGMDGYADYDELVLLFVKSKIN